MTEKKTRIAIIDHVGLKAGMECYDQELLFALKDAGCDVRVFSNFSSLSPGDGIVQVFNFRVKQNIFSFIGLWRKYYRLAEEIRKQKIDFCILHGFRFGYPEWLLARNLGKTPAKICLIVHDPGSLIGNTESGKWKKKIFGICHRLIVHNRYSFDQLAVELTPGEQKKLVIIPHGNFIRSVVRKKASPDFSNESIVSGQKKRLLFFGQIKATKGLEMVLEALALTEPGIELIIAGRMRKQSFGVYHKLIVKHQLKDRVKLHIGYIDPALRDELFRQADAIVLPYSKVYQSGVLMMAMSFGKPVIVSDLPPFREIITDRQNGFLYENGNSGDLAKSIQYVMENEDIRNSAGKAGYQFVNDNMDWRVIAMEWKKLFDS